MSPTKLLLITLSEYGQSNTFLALLQELQTRQNVDVHFVSYSELQKRVQNVARKSDNPDAVSTTFHALSGATYKEIYTRDVDLSTKKYPDFVHPPTSKSLEVLHEMIYPINLWTEKEFIGTMNQVRGLIDKIEPDLILVDFMFMPAREACRLSGRKFIVNSPIQVLDFVRPLQPRLKWIWHYPA